MSTLQVANITGIASINAVSYQSNGATILTGNTTVTQLQVNSANTLVANSTATLLTVGGTTTLTANTTGITSAGIVADSVATIRPLVNMTVNGGGTNPFPASLGPANVDFTGIPSWVKRITFSFTGLSTNGSSIIEVRLGTAGGIVSSGYLGATTGTTYTDGMALSNSVTSTNIYNGVLTIVNLTGNTWCSFGCSSRSDGATTHTIGYSIALAAALTQVRLTTVNGTDLFDAGSVNVMYE